MTNGRKGPGNAAQTSRRGSPWFSIAPTRDTEGQSPRQGAAPGDSAGSRRSMACANKRMAFRAGLRGRGNSSLMQACSKQYGGDEREVVGRSDQTYVLASLFPVSNAEIVRSGCTHPVHCSLHRGAMSPARRGSRSSRGRDGMTKGRSEGSLRRPLLARSLPGINEGTIVRWLGDEITWRWWQWWPWACHGCDYGVVVVVSRS
jgi:hypothetical protein